MVEYYVCKGTFYKIEDNLVYYLLSPYEWKLSAFIDNVNSFLMDEYILPIKMNEIDVLLYNLE